MYYKDNLFMSDKNASILIVLHFHMNNKSLREWTLRLI